MIHLTNLESYVCLATTPVHVVLSRFNELPHQLHLVVDEAGLLLGSVTDGDIRRGFLNGMALDEPISRCMHAGAITGRIGQESENLAALSSVEFLPLLDDNGRVVELLAQKPSPAAFGTCLVMAGGPGTRLGKKTRSLPKPLLPVGDKPILEHILSRLEADGVEEVFIAVHYLAEKIESFIAERDNRCTVRLLHEGDRLGTAGALGSLPKANDQPVLVINGDIVTSVDYVALHKFHQRSGYDATLAMARYDIEVPFGVVRQTSEGLFSGIDEKPVLQHFVSAGIYYLSPEFCALVPEGHPMDMPELLNLGCRAGLSVGLFPIHEYWIDVGRPDDLRSANGDEARVSRD